MPVRILVCDEDAEVLSLVSTRLKARGYEMHEFLRKEEALQYLDGEAVDLVLLSTEVDRHSGSYLIEKIRKKPHLSTVPIIMMTRKDHIADLIVGQDRGFDDFLIKPFDTFILQLRVAINIRKTRDRLDVNALTHLPGNHAIERFIHHKIESGDKFSVVYIDINHFKSFNDRYGFEKGDDVIRHTARILMAEAEKHAAGHDYFVGHIGGDDFVAVLHPDNEEAFARGFIDAFDRIIVTYYNEEDQKRGCVKVTNRRGKRETFPLMSCSVAACNNLYRPYRNLGEIAQDAAQVKSFLKSQPGSHYLRDRRSEPIRQLRQAVEILSPQPARKKARRHEPLGRSLLAAGLVNEEQLSRALKKQFETGKRLGQILIGMKAVSSEKVGEILGRKLGVPYVSLREAEPSQEMLKIFTPEFMKSRRLVPIEKSGTKLRLAMCDPHDGSTVQDVERITGLKPVPCMTLENELEEFWRNRPEEWIGREQVG